MDQEAFSKKVLNATYTFIGVPSAILLSFIIASVAGVMGLIAVIACLVLLGAGAAGIKHRDTIKRAWTIRHEQ